MDEDSLSSFEDLLEVLRRNNVQEYRYGPNGLHIKFGEPPYSESAEGPGFVRQSDRIAAREAADNEVRDSADPYQHPSLGRLIGFSDED